LEQFLTAKALTSGSAPEESTRVEASPAPLDGAVANVVVLSGDASLIELTRQAVDGRQRVWRADDAMHAVELLIAAQSGVLFIDVGMTTHETPALIDRLHEQFPELPIVVAGRRDDETALGQRISSGAVFRFLHKPVSSDRIRTFIEAGVRRLGDQPLVLPPEPEPDEAPSHAARLPRLRLDPAMVRRLATASLWSLGALLVAATVVVLLGQRPWERIALPGRPETAQEPVPAGDARTAQQPDAGRLLGAAALALTQDRLAEPEGQNALELYRAVLLRDPQNEEARRGLARTSERLLLRVEAALLAGDTSAAARALDAARFADPANPRLEFFSAQLRRERELESASTATLPAESAALAERALTEQVDRLLGLADTRMKERRLSGGGDSAEAYVLEAKSLRPGDPGVVQAMNALSGRMLLAASEALASGDTTSAAGWLDRADALGVDDRNVARLRAQMESMRLASVQEDRSRLLALANQRIAQGRLLEPAGDSARHYLDLLRAADPGYDGLLETQSLQAAALLARARTLAEDGRTAEAERAVAAAEEAGARPDELSSTRSMVSAGRAVARAATEVLPEGALVRTESRPVRYPPRARDRRIEGWVDVEFTVGADGTTREATILGSSPEGVFEDAVLDAVGAWRYEPRVVAGTPVDQRVSMRLRFQLDGG
jgi:protein TonB